MSKSVKTILVGVLLVFLAFGFLGSRGIWQPDEGYYVATAVTMQEQNNWLVPKMGESIFLEKPPMMYWGIMAGFQFLGRTEFAARAFHGICYLATGVIVIFLGRRIFPGTEVGLWGGVMFMTMPIPFIAASYITPDMPLTLMTTLAMLAFWQSLQPQTRHADLWKVAMCAMLGLGFLCKGPAALIPTAGMFVYLMIHGRVRQYFFTRSAWICAATFLVTGLWWYGLISIRVPGAARYFFDNQIWGRLVSDKYERNPGLGGALIYFPTILLGCLPWSIGWFSRRKVWMNIKSPLDIWRWLDTDPAGSFLFCWIVVPLLVLSLASSKLPLYSLPLFPALAIGSAALWIRDNSVDGILRPDHLRRTVITIVIWSGIMLLIRLCLAFYPTPNDMRNLWAEIKPHLPSGLYEILTLDEPADGLVFYGAHEVENITLRPNPYPFFTMPETLPYELGEIQDDQHPYQIIAHNPKILSLIRNLLHQREIRFREVPLRFERTLLLCDRFQPSESEIPSE
ncbi:MAG: glycosyltransferase family 39 protein [Phycisphaerae bacterium]|nr:glycosyltransferase family 39 protein [Phycisphaerae bacterium]